MSITPTAESGQTITASDENSRNNEISTKFNAHSHTDISTISGVNTLTIGDGAVGNKTYAVNTDQSNDPGLRYNTTVDMWQLSQDGSTYLAAAHAETTAGLNSGAMLFASGGAVSAAIVDAGNATNGQILIGRSGGTPIIGNISSSGAATVANGFGTITVGTTFATPALTLGTSNSAGSADSLIRSDATVAAFDATVPTTITHGAAAATGSAAVVARRDHTHGAPASPSWEFVETLATTSGTSVTSATLPTDSDLFMVVFEEVGCSGAASLGFATMSQVLSIQGTTTTDTASTEIAQFGSSGGKNVNGVIYVPRLAEGSARACPANIGWYTSADARSVTIGAFDESGAGTFTTLTFSVGANAFDEGKIHIYKSIPS